MYISAVSVNPPRTPPPSSTPFSPSPFPSHPTPFSPLTQVSVDIIELDPEILNVAEKWFGFVQGEGVRVCVGDGVEAIMQKCAAGEKGECWFSGVHETLSESPPAWDTFKLKFLSLSLF